MSSAQEPGERLRTPPKQDHYRRAAEMAFTALAHQADEQLRWLGAEPRDGAWRVPVLDDAIEVDLSKSRVSTSDGREVGDAWRILALHYLLVTSRPERREPEITFDDLPTARSYAGVYHGRVIARLCATAGRDGESLRAAAKTLGGHPADGGDAAFDFDVFPRVLVRLIWHAPDDEFPPSATLLLPANISDYFCSEDTVVLTECLVARLGGRPF